MEGSLETTSPNALFYIQRNWSPEREQVLIKVIHLGMDTVGTIT